MQKHGLRFRPDMARIIQLLPEVHSFELRFVQPDAANPYLLTDLAREVTLQFRNDTQLILNGVFFWKFLDSIPPELGSDAHGWNDDNPHGPGTTEYLMRRLRSAYQLMLEDEGVDFEVRPPLTAILDFETEQLDVVYPAELPADVFAALLDQMASLRPSIRQALANRIKQTILVALTEPRSVMETYDAGNGYLGRRVALQSWSADALDSVTVESFRMELVPDEGTPWRRSYLTLISELMEHDVYTWFVTALGQLEHSALPLFEQVARGLRFTVASSDGQQAEAIHQALRESRDYEKLFNLLWTEIFPKNSETWSLRTFLNSL